MRVTEALKTIQIEISKAVSAIPKILSALFTKIKTIFERQKATIERELVCELRYFKPLPKFVSDPINALVLRQRLNAILSKQGMRQLPHPEIRPVRSISSPDVVRSSSGKDSLPEMIETIRSSVQSVQGEPL